MKKILTAILMITTASVIFAGIVLAETGKGTVDVSELNFRESASTSANAIDVLYRGAKVNIISEQGDWYKVKYNNEEGYVSKQYITREDTSNTTNNTNTDNSENTSNNSTSNTTENTTEPSNNDTNPPVDFDTINTTKIKEETTIYVLPLINSTKLGKVNANTNVLLISVNGDWAYVQTENKNGWVFRKTLEKDSITIGSQSANANNGDNSNNNENNTTTEPTVTPTPVPTTTTSEYPTTMYVNVEAVNVRSQANTTSTIVTSIGKNVPITVEAKEGDWYKVKTSDGNGYIKSEYLSKNR